MTTTRHEVVLNVGSGLPVASRDGLPVAALDLGAAHPSSHGVIQLRIVVEGDTVVEAEPIVGYLHRGAEKLFEVRDYRQAMVLANRHDWLSAFGNELGIALAVERMLGMEVPARATWLRTAMSELTRVLVHLSFLGAFPVGTGVRAPAYYAHTEREAVQRLLELATGGRMHHMLNRVGGLREDVPASWTAQAREVLPVVRRGLDPLAEFLASADVVERTRGVGVLTREQVLAFGVSGPMARASGVDLDLRRDDPSLAYAELRDAGVLRVVTRDQGDAHARLEVMLEQTAVSLDLVEECLRHVDDEPGPVNVKLPKVLRAPEGLTYVWTENPLGTSGWLLVSRAERTPWRLKLRSASFNNVAVLGELLVGVRVADLVTVLASCPYVVGDVDK